MWSSLFAMSLVLGLLRPIDVQEPVHIFQDQGVLMPSQQKIALLPMTRKDAYLSVSATGDEFHADLDCYLLQNHRIIALDERNSNQCQLGVVLKTNQPVSLWYINHGTAPLNYQIAVSEK